MMSQEVRQQEYRFWSDGDFSYEQVSAKGAQLIEHEQEHHNGLEQHMNLNR